MAIVKGSAQYNMRVMPYRPMRRMFNYVIGLLMLIAISLSSYLIGYDHGFRQLALPGGARDKLREGNDSLAKETETLRQQVANFKLNAALDQKASEDIRRQLMEQAAQIAALERDITVYRGMISSSGKNANPQGISVGVFSVIQTDKPDVYHFKLAVQKLAATDDLFKGYLNFKLSGVQKLQGQEQARSFSLRELSNLHTDEQVPLTFKYFQNIEGNLVLPEGFSPAKVVLLVKSTSKKYPATLEKELEWQVSEF